MNVRFRLFTSLFVAKPTRSWIEHEGDVLTNGHHLSLTEGDYLKLACTVIDGRPAPIIKWYSIDSFGQRYELKKSTDIDSVDDLKLSNSSIDGRSDRATFILTKKLKREDLATRIECQIEHEAIENGALDQYVSLDVSGKNSKKSICLSFPFPLRCHQSIKFRMI